MAIATATRTVTLNAAFLQEIKDDNRHLRDLRKAIRALISNRTLVAGHLPRLLALLEEFRDQLAMHFSLEEAYGYFDDAVDVAPRLSEAVDRLRSQHSDLFGILVHLVGDAESLLRHQRSDEQLDEFIERVQDFDSALSDHELRESQLMMEAMDRDLGGEG